MSKQFKKKLVKASGSKMNQYCCVLLIAVVAGAMLVANGMVTLPFSGVTTPTTPTTAPTQPTIQYELEIWFEWKAGSGSDFQISVFEIVASPFIQAIVYKSDSGGWMGFGPIYFLSGQVINIGLEFLGNADGSYEQLPWPHSTSVPMSGRIYADYLPAGGAPITDAFYLDYRWIRV